MMDGSKSNAEEDAYHALLNLRSRKIPRSTPDGSKDREYDSWRREDNDWEIPEADSDGSTDDSDESTDDSDECTDNLDGTMDNLDATMDNPDATMDNPDVMSTDILDAIDGDGQPKKTRKPRRPNMIGTGRLKVTRVDDVGEPVSPRKASMTYGNAIGCIVRETCNINESNLRARDKSNLRDALINKLHTRFEFPKDVLDLVENHAMTKFSKALINWKCMARKNFVDEGKDFADVHKQWPRISEHDWALFKDNCNTERAKKLSKWGKDMRSKNIGNHKLGSRGYVGKGPVWDKEDAEFENKGIANPWGQFKEPLELSYVRARVKYDEMTDDFIADDKTKILVNELKKEYEEPQSSQGSSARWDCPLTRAINKTLGKSPRKRPSGGRVNGAGGGGGALWRCKFPESKEERKARRRAANEKQMEDVRRLALEEYQAQFQAEAQQKAQDALHSMLPSVVAQVKAWVDNGKQGEFQLQPLVGSTSAAAPNASFQNSLAIAPHHSSPCVSFMGAQASPKAPAAPNASFQNSPAVAPHHSSPCVSFMGAQASPKAPAAPNASFQNSPAVAPHHSRAAPNASFQNSPAVASHHSSPCVSFMGAQESPKADQAGDYSIKRCISEMMKMALSTDEKAAAFDVLKDPDNREIFLSSKEDDPQAALVWLRKVVAKL